ncbi:hypothetical protein ASF37_02040 [Aeromicrobium sp. Leaf289]|uniref:DUF2306 domain-containing protein n=1 Tax=Aeromicrobium sp. Leaf289 TaxID=1736324 RepID=UPI0006F37AE9|nr:DUF2306 domain-containing protein [Aeromicrobium sp. Leaf289]KQP79814.1 hypothetical protein ASF37_02040 [Aeromicrobium sp. Leaf289]
MTPLIATHAFAAVVALLVGAWQLFRGARGTQGHRVAGRVWVVALMFVAASSFWIQEIRPGHFSALHALSVVTLVTVPLGILGARQGRIRDHRSAMTGNWIGLVGAGIAAAAVPDRAIPQLVVHDAVTAGVAGLAVLATAAAVIGVGRVVDAAVVPQP